MQVIIPLAGKGTRLRPHTHLVPKPMLKVAGRPVMDWVMDRLAGLDVTELIIITGHLRDQVEEYATGRYGVPCRYIEQQVQDGTAGAINLARPHVTGPVLIIFVDTVFEADLSVIHTAKADGIIWAKEVEDYQRFGVVVTDEKGYMTRIVEKPSEPISKLANIGLYYIKDVAALWQGIDKVLAAPAQQGRVLPHRRLPVDDRERQEDPHRRSGRLVRLRQARHPAGDQPDPAAEGRGQPFGTIPGCHPSSRCWIEDGVTLRALQRSAPTSPSKGHLVRDSTLTHTIVGQGCDLSGVTLTQSMLGNAVTVRNFRGTASLGDHSELDGIG